MKTLTIKDIAKIAGVSVTTVSMIINNRHHGISEKTRNKVLTVIKDNNYVPSSIARSMVTKTTNILGLILPDVTNPYFADMARVIEKSAGKRGYNVILCNADDNLEKELEYINILKEKQVDGLILVSTVLSQHKGIQDFNQYNIPVVVLDRRITKEHKRVICFDNVQGGYIATKHLLNNGHTKIGCIIGFKQNQSSKDRLAGYKKALEEHKIAFDAKLVCEGNYKMEGGKQAIKKLMQQANITAVFAFNDLMAIGVYKGIAQANLKIPNDISVVGFDDLYYLSDLISPGLTTVKQPAAEMANEAVRMLDAIVNKREETEKFIQFQPLLVERESVLNLNNKRNKN